jgi:hypothetical protein
MKSVEGISKRLKVFLSYSVFISNVSFDVLTVVNMKMVFFGMWRRVVWYLAAKVHGVLSRNTILKQIVVSHVCPLDA